jgi:hypothetical protein
MGQLTRIANRVAESKDPTILKYTETSETWLDFVNNQLAEINHTNDIKLGGKDPRGAVEEDQDLRDMQNQLPSFMQKFSKYFNVASKGSYQQKEEEEEEEEEDQNDDELNRAHEEEEEEEEEEVEHIEEEEDEDKQIEQIYSNNDVKHIFKFSGDKSNELEGHNHHSSYGRHSYGHLNHDYDEEIEEEEEVPDHKEEEVEFDEPTQGSSEDLQMEEQVLDPEFYENTYWRRENWHSADEILEEVESI